MYSAWCNWSLSWSGTGFYWGHRPAVNHTDRAADSRATNTSKYPGSSCTPPHTNTANMSDSMSVCKPLCWGLSLAVVLQWGARASGESCSTNKPLLNLTCSTMWWGLVCFEMCSRLAWHRYSLYQCTLFNNWLKKGLGRDLELYPAAFWDNMFWCPMMTCWFYVAWKIWLTDSDATQSK